MTVSFKGESEETIREALEALDTIEPSSAEHAAKIEAQRQELQRELFAAPQGRLF